MATTKGTELAIVDPTQYAVLQADPVYVADLLRETLGGGQIGARDFETFKVPSQGMTLWTVTDRLTGEVTTTPEIQGVIIHSKAPRAFWLEKFSGGGTPPDCSAEAGLIGDGMFGPGSDENPTGECRTCPMAKFGSAKTLWPEAAKSESQACKQNRLLFILRERGFLPAVIKGPPASLQGIKQYMLALASEGFAASSVVTRFMLEQDKAGGIVYSRIVPKFGQRLSPEAQQRVQGIAAQIRFALDGATFEGWRFDTDTDAVEGEAEPITV
jgi:hypothetical protein